MNLSLPRLPQLADDHAARSVSSLPPPLKGGKLTDPLPPTPADVASSPSGKWQPWLEQQVENTRRAARPRTCPRCDADVLVGPDHDTCALTVTVDAAPVDPVTEVAALLAGRMSFDLVRGNLHHREPEHIHGRRNSHPILLTHVCDKETLW